MIIAIVPIPIIEIDGRLAWKFAFHGEYSIKIVIWANNESIRPHPKANSLLVLANKFTSQIKVVCLKTCLWCILSYKE